MASRWIVVVCLGVVVACGGPPASPAASAAGPAEASPQGSPEPGAPPPAGEQASAPSVPASAGPDADGAYHIILNRPAQVGSVRRQHTRATDHSLSRLRIGKREVERQEIRLRVDFLATRRILAVGPRGRATQSEFTVERFVADDAKGGEPVMKPGTVFVVKKTEDGEPIITLRGGGELSPQARHVVKLVVSGRKGGASADDIFGIDAPQKPGASWPANAELAARDLQGTGFVADPSAVRGQSTFVGIVDERGIPAMEIASRMQVTARAFEGLPPGGKLERASMSAVHLGLYPIETSVPPVRESTTMSIDVRAAIPTDQGQGVLEITGSRVSETSYELIGR